MIIQKCTPLSKWYIPKCFLLIKGVRNQVWIILLDLRHWGAPIFNRSLCRTTSIRQVVLAPWSEQSLHNSVYTIALTGTAQSPAHRSGIHSWILMWWHHIVQIVQCETTFWVWCKRFLFSGGKWKYPEIALLHPKATNIWASGQNVSYICSLGQITNL